MLTTLTRASLALFAFVLLSSSAYGILNIPTSFLKANAWDYNSSLDANYGHFYDVNADNNISFGGNLVAVNNGGVQANQGADWCPLIYNPLITFGTKLGICFNITSSPGGLVFYYYDAPLFTVHPTDGVWALGNIDSDANISADGNVSAGESFIAAGKSWLQDINAASINAKTLFVDGNASADYFTGDGSQLTNLPAGANPFDQNLNTTNNVSFKDLNADGNSTFGRTTGTDLNYSWIDGNGFHHTTQSGSTNEAAYGFSGTDKNTGMYLSTAGTLGFLAQGQQLFTCSKFSCTIIIPYTFASGISVANSISAGWDINGARNANIKGTTMFGTLSDTNQFRIDNNGMAKMHVGAKSRVSCSAANKGYFYYETSLDEPCFCNGTTYTQFDGGGAC